MFIACLISILAAFLYSLTNHIDKFLVDGVDKAGSNVKTLLLFSTLVSGLVFAPIMLIVTGFDFKISLISFISVISAAISSSIALYFYFKSLEKSDVSIVVVMFQLIPVFSYIMGVILFNETLSFRQITGSLIIIVSTILISINIENKTKSNFKVLLLMALSSFLYSVYYILFDIGIRHSSYNACIFYLQVGFLLVGLVLICIKSFRTTFVKAVKNNGKKYFSLNVINELLNITAGALENYANVLVPIALVTVITRIQVIFVFILGLIGTLLLPKIFNEDISRKTIFKKVFCIILSIIGFVVAFA